MWTSRNGTLRTLQAAAARRDRPSGYFPSFWPAITTATSCIIDREFATWSVTARAKRSKHRLAQLRGFTQNLPRSQVFLQTIVLNNGATLEMPVGVPVEVYRPSVDWTNAESAPPGSYKPLHMLLQEERKAWEAKQAQVTQEEEASRQATKQGGKNRQKGATDATAAAATTSAATDAPTATSNAPTATATSTKQTATTATSTKQTSTAVGATKVAAATTPSMLTLARTASSTRKEETNLKK